MKKASKKGLKFAVLAADTALFTIKDNKLLVRLIEINRPPHFVSIYGLPGGLLSPTETAEEAAERNLETKGGVDAVKVYSEQLYTFSKVNRDPRGRVVAVAYLALAPWQTLSSKEREGSKSALWHEVSRIPHLAYDHEEIVKMALKRLRSRISYTSIISKIMPSKFTMTELQEAYSCILGRKLDKRNFRKKMFATGLLKELKGVKSGGKHRPAALYSFVTKEVGEIDNLIR